MKLAIFTSRIICKEFKMTVREKKRLGNGGSAENDLKCHKRRKEGN